MRRLLSAAALLLVLAFAATPSPRADDVPEKLRLSIGSDGYSVDVRDLEKMPTAKIVTRTPFLPDTATFEGVLLRDLLQAAHLDVPRLMMTALNDYQVEVPASDAVQYDVIVAYKVDGQYLRVRDKGPFWLIYPLDQHPELRNEQTATKMIWQMKSIVGE